MSAGADRSGRSGRLATPPGAPPAPESRRTIQIAGGVVSPPAVPPFARHLPGGARVARCLAPGSSGEPRSRRLHPDIVARPAMPCPVARWREGRASGDALPPAASGESRSPRLHLEVLATPGDALPRRPGRASFHRACPTAAGIPPSAPRHRAGLAFWHGGRPHSFDKPHSGRDSAVGAAPPRGAGFRRAGGLIHSTCPTAAGIPRRAMLRRGARSSGPSAGRFSSHPSSSSPRRTAAPPPRARR